MRRRWPKLDLKHPMTVAVVGALIGGAFAILAALLGAFATGHDPTLPSATPKPAVTRISRVPEPALRSEVEVVEGTASELPAGERVYAVGRPTKPFDGRAATGGTASGPRQSTHWIVSDGVLPDSRGIWKAFIYFSSVQRVAYTYEAVEMAPNEEPCPPGATCGGPDRTVVRLEKKGPRIAHRISRPFTAAAPAG